MAACTLVELGCGNGRDALWLAGRLALVVAVDQAHSSVSRLTAAVAEHPELAPHVRFVQADFTALPRRDEAPLSVASGSGVQCVYARFTLHAVDAPSASRALRWAWRELAPGGLLALEARSVLGAMYGQGDAVPGERDAFVLGHYRRFLRRDEMCAELRQLGFELEHVDERAGLAPYGTDDPVLLRILARKPLAVAATATAAAAATL